MISTCRWYGLVSQKGAVSAPRPARIIVARPARPVRVVGGLPKVRVAPLSDAFGAGEEAGGAEEEDEDDDHEADGIAVAGGDVARAQLLGYAEQEPADGRARDVAVPA